MKNINKIFIFFAIFIFSSFTFSQETNIDLIREPILLEHDDVFYPNKMQRLREEGWVHVNFMVAADGGVFEPTVVSSMGDVLFQNLALKTIQSATFEPATLNGEPIISSSTYIFGFKIKGESGAGRAFIRVFRKLSEKLEEGSEEELRVLLGEINENGVKTFYEDAYINWARYRIAKRFGNDLEQLEYLSAALALEYNGIIDFSSASVTNEEKYLSREMVKNGLREKFRLEVANNRFAEAIQTYGALVITDDTEAVESFEPAYDQIVAIENSESSYGIDVKLNEVGAWSFLLHKHQVYFDKVIGAIDEIKFRCSNKFVALPVDIELVYTIPAVWGACSMQIIGSPGASFSLVQQ